MAVAMPDESPPPETGIRTLRDLGQILGDLQPGGALAGDDAPVVVRLDHHHAALRHQVERNLVPLVRARSGEDDLGAVTAHALDLDLRRGLGHHDHRRGAEQPRRARHRLGVVAG